MSLRKIFTGLGVTAAGAVYSAARDSMFNFQPGDERPVPAFSNHRNSILLDTGVVLAAYIAINILIARIARRHQEAYGMLAMLVEHVGDRVQNHDRRQQENGGHEQPQQMQDDVEGRPNNERVADVENGGDYGQLPAEGVAHNQREGEPDHPPVRKLR